MGQWSGPIESGFGLHLVKVDERTAGKAPTLAEIRPIVLREWQSEERRRQNQALLDTLKSKYEIRVEGPAAELFASSTAGAAK